jgi:antitoxin ParD1/3/4
MRLTDLAKNGNFCHNKVGTQVNGCFMSTVNISLPESMKAYIDEQVATGGYGSVSEFFRDLIRQDQKRKAKENLETLLLEGLDSGTSTPMSAQDWEDIRLAVQGKIAHQQKLNDG